MSDLFPAVIETERLRFERCRHENLDLLDYYRICSADDGIDEVTQYMPWDPHDHPKESAEFVDGREEAWAEGRSADYLVRPRAGEDEAGEFAGMTGLGLDWDRRLGSLGLWLRRPFWGRGYSGERAAALFELGFDRLDLEIVDVTHHVDNEKSRRAIEKYVERFGGRRDGRLRNYRDYGDEVVDEIRYTVHREEWAGHRPDDLAIECYDDAADAPPRPGGDGA